MKKVRLGIIGCGSMSRYHGRVYTTQVPEVDVVALCDTHKGNLDRYQREVFDPIKKKPPTFADYKDMLAKVNLDAVLIVTRTLIISSRSVPHWMRAVMCWSKSRWW